MEAIETDRLMKYKQYLDYIIIGFIFLLLFLLPVLFTRVDGQISWLHVTKIWKDQVLLIPLFAINHWFIVPKMLLQKKYVSYLLCVISLIALFTCLYYYQDEILNKKPKSKLVIENKRPDPIPPYANLLMYSLLIVGIDTGLLFSKRWHEIEQKKNLLEKENAEIQLNMLRTQVSPHFFMNTLNNIFALIDCNVPAAKESVMKLSKLMRYILYESDNGKVKLIKEFEFIKSYIDLMKLRFAEGMSIHLIIPDHYPDASIPPMLFISYIENAFKYGASYQEDSFISIIFEINDNKLLFTCNNTNHADANRNKVGGIGLINNESRLKLLYGKNFALATKSSEKMFYVSLVIPLS